MAIILQPKSNKSIVKLPQNHLHGGGLLVLIEHGGGKHVHGWVVHIGHVKKPYLLTKIK